MTNIASKFTYRRFSNCVKKKLASISENMIDDPPPITEEDIEKGMITLLNRGIIPKDVDLSIALHLD